MVLGTTGVLAALRIALAIALLISVHAAKLASGSSLRTFSTRSGSPPTKRIGTLRVAFCRRKYPATSRPCDGIRPRSITKINNKEFRRRAPKFKAAGVLAIGEDRHLMPELRQLLRPLSSFVFIPMHEKNPAHIELPKHYSAIETRAAIPLRYHWCGIAAQRVGNLWIERSKPSYSG